MDFSSLTESQQQQLQQLQTQYQQHQQQRQDAAATATATAAAAAAQQQQQHDQSQAQSYYNTSHQPQSYDQSYYSYYQNQDPQQSQQYAAYYHNSDYANAYQPQQPQQQPQQQMQMQQQQYSQAETVAVPYNTQAAPPPEAQVIEHQQNDKVGQGGDQSNSGYNVPNGINGAAAAAAMAALSQLTQFAAERGMGGSQETQWYGNGGGYGPPMGHDPFMGPLHHGPPIGRSPYRGGGRRGGSPFRGGRGNFTGGSGPPFRGRGRGRGRGGRPHPPHGASSSSLPEGSSAEGTGEGEPFQADVGNQQPIRIAWCELCRVDCTSLEILEQHKNGKRHKKNLERLEEMKGSYKPTTEVQNDGKINADAPDSVLQGEGEKRENILTEVDSDQNQGMKRKMRGGGRGGKRVKTYGGPSRRSLGPTKTKPVIPLICDLCNVKCDTQEVFDRHVSGKKHISKVKRFEGHQAMYGPTGVQALYPPNPMAQALSHPQVPQQAFHGGPQGSYPPPPEAYIPPQVQNPNPQLSDAPLEFNHQNNVAQVQQPSASVEQEIKQVTSQT